MKLLFERKFLKEVSSADKHTKQLVEHAILNAEHASTLLQVNNLKKLKGSKDAYRIRVGNYRIGIYFIHNQLVFARLLHRKEIYRYFP